MKRLSIVAVAALVAFSVAGCTGYQKALAAYNVIQSIVNVAQADLPTLQAAGVFSPAEAPVIGGYVQLVGTLNGQYSACITNAQNSKLATSGKFIGCLNVFSAGLSDPKELASLRLLNPKAQSKVQLWATALQIGLNVALSNLGAPQPQAPVIAASAPTSAELLGFAAHIGYQRGF